MESFRDGLIDSWFKSKDTVFISGHGKYQISNSGIILRSTDAGISRQQVGQSQNSHTYCWKLQFTFPAIGYSSCQEFLTGGSHI